MPHLAWPPLPQLQHRTVRYGSVCSGIEAATVAWHVLPGWEPVWVSQFDPEHNYDNGPDFASAVLAERIHGVPNLGDMTADDWMQRAAALGDIDVLVGGTPCQDFSVAGLRLGLHGDRGQLTLRYCEIANAANPTFVLWENVPGVLSDKTNGFGCLLAGLAGEDDALVPPGGRWTDAGVVSGPQRTIAWRVIDAQYGGLAQRRRRVFALACPAASGIDPCAVLFEFDGVRRDSPPSRATGEDAAAATGGGAAGAGRDGGAGCVNVEAGLAAHGSLDLRDVCEPLTATEHKGKTAVYTGDGQVADPIGASEAKTYTHEGVTFRMHNCVQQGVDFRNGVLTGDVAIPVQAGGQGSERGRCINALPGVLQGVDLRNGRVTGDVAMTLQAGQRGHTPDPGGTPHLLQPVPLMDPQRRSSGGGKDLVRAGMGIGAAGDPMFTLNAGRPHGVAQAFVKTHRATSPTDAEIWREGEVAPTVTAKERDHHDGQTQAVALCEGAHGCAEVEAVPTLQSQGGGKPGQGYHAVRTAAQVRRLTPTECERLQGFPDGWTLIGWKGKSPEDCPDGPRYRALGNSMAVPIMRWIGLRMHIALTNPQLLEPKP